MNAARCFLRFILDGSASQAPAASVLVLVAVEDVDVAVPVPVVDVDVEVEVEVSDPVPVPVLVEEVSEVDVVDVVVGSAVPLVDVVVGSAVELVAVEVLVGEDPSTMRVVQAMQPLPAPPAPAPTPAAPVGRTGCSSCSRLGSMWSRESKVVGSTGRVRSVRASTGPSVGRVSVRVPPLVGRVKILVSLSSRESKVVGSTGRVRSVRASTGPSVGRVRVFVPTLVGRVKVLVSLSSRESKVVGSTGSVRSVRASIRVASVGRVRVRGLRTVTVVGLMAAVPVNPQGGGKRILGLAVPLLAPRVGLTKALVLVLVPSESFAVLVVPVDRVLLDELVVSVGSAEVDVEVVVGSGLVPVEPPPCWARMKLMYSVGRPSGKINLVTVAPPAPGATVVGSGRVVVEVEVVEEVVVAVSEPVVLVLVEVDSSACGAGRGAARTEPWRSAARRTKETVSFIMSLNVEKRDVVLEVNER